MPLSEKPETAWLPLAEADWNADAARHLLRRAGWTATQPETDRALGDGLGMTLDRLFPAAPAPFPLPEKVAQFAEEAPLYAARAKAAESPEARRLVQRERNEHGQAAIQQMSLEWLAFAARPENSAYAKWVQSYRDLPLLPSPAARLLWGRMWRRAPSPAPSHTQTPCHSRGTQRRNP